MEKYDKDVEAKTHELEVLKASKANDLARLQEFTKLVSTCSEYTPPSFEALDVSIISISRKPV